jgi:hypothetical protein
MGQFGNQLFQIAAAYAYSLDHHLPLSIPQFFSDSRWNIDKNSKRLFENRLAALPISEPAVTWREPSFNYNPIPAYPSIHLFGWFQTEKYFKHRRQEILELFAPPPELELEIWEKYPFLSSSSMLVGVQIRDYRVESLYVNGDYHPTHKRNYYKNAVKYFPEGTTFVVTSNNLNLAKECMDRLAQNIIYLDSGDYIEEFYVLTQCDSFIISNSSFGWWAAWLSSNVDKIVIVPRPWHSPPYDDDITCKDLIPDDWIIVNVNK